MKKKKKHIKDFFFSVKAALLVTAGMRGCVEQEKLNLYSANLL